MDLDNSGCGGVAALALFLLVMVPVVLLVANVGGDAFTDARAQRLHAEAALVREQSIAEERIIVARETAFEQRFAMWTVALAAFTGGVTLKDLLLVVAVGCGAVAVGYVVGIGRRLQ